MCSSFLSFRCSVRPTPPPPNSPAPSQSTSLMEGSVLAEHNAVVLGGWRSQTVGRRVTCQREVRCLSVCPSVWHGKNQDAFFFCSSSIRISFRVRLWQQGLESSHSCDSRHWTTSEPARVRWPEDIPLVFRRGVVGSISIRAPKLCYNPARCCWEKAVI